MLFYNILLLFVHLQVVSSFQDCPLLGPVFPSPTKFNSSVIQNAASNLTEAINNAISTGGINGSTASFSIEIFSTNSASSFFTHHHSAPNLNASLGVTTVNSNSVYRIGSISKLFTVLTLLISDGDVHFTDPVTKYVPELAKAAQGYSKDQALSSVDWEAVTIGSLASQISGIAREFYSDEYMTLLDGIDLGLPALNSSDLPLCTFAAPCERSLFFQEFLKRHPFLAPSTTPMYSNVAYQILSFAIEGITKTPFQKLLHNSIIEKLEMNSTSYLLPNTTNGVVPGGLGIDGSWWEIDTGAERAAGNMYSSVADMVKLGKAILSAQLIQSDQTRRWMKPTSHISMSNYAFGAPWEIYRMEMKSPRAVDLYTKSGGLSWYNAEFAVIPDWDIGFIVMGVGPNFSSDILSNLIATIMFPAVEEAARQEADVKYAGHYQSPTLNSSATIVTEIGRPGLGITAASINGKDLFEVLSANPFQLSLRLYPTGLEKSGIDGAGEVGWVMISESTANSTASNGPFGTGCTTWGTIGYLSYGGKSLDDWRFIVGADGIATGIEPQVLGVSMNRV